MEKQLLRIIHAANDGKFPAKFTAEQLNNIAMQIGITVTRLRKIISDVRQQVGVEASKFSTSALDSAWRKAGD